jgi:hypothetical protein
VCVCRSKLFGEVQLHGGQVWCCVALAKRGGASVHTICVDTVLSNVNFLLCCCAGGQGEATDYYLYVSARNDDACRSGAAAWALPCLFDPATNRPLLGTANLCPSSLAQDDAHAAAAVLVHELHHALGFTDQLLDKFIDAQGQPIPEDKVRGAVAGRVLLQVTCSVLCVTGRC